MNPYPSFVAVGAVETVLTASYEADTISLK